MNESAPYVPIACGLYDEYELAILRRGRLRLRWRDTGNTAREASVEPLGLFVRDGIEYLRVRSGQEETNLRLDWIEHFAHEMKS